GRRERALERAGDLVGVDAGRAQWTAGRTYAAEHRAGGGPEFLEDRQFGARHRRSSVEGRDDAIGALLGVSVARQVEEDAFERAAGAAFLQPREAAFDRDPAVLQDEIGRSSWRERVGGTAAG